MAVSLFGEDLSSAYTSWDGINLNSLIDTQLWLIKAEIKTKLPIVKKNGSSRQTCHGDA